MECLVCLDNFSQVRQIHLLPCCGQSICGNCASSLTTCPNCRCVLPSQLPRNRTLEEFIHRQPSHANVTPQYQSPNLVDTDETLEPPSIPDNNCKNSTSSYSDLLPKYHPSYNYPLGVFQTVGHRWRCCDQNTREAPGCHEGPVRHHPKEWTSESRGRYPCCNQTELSAPGCRERIEYYHTGSLASDGKFTCCHARPASSTNSPSFASIFEPPSLSKGCERRQTQYHPRMWETLERWEEWECCHSRERRGDGCVLGPYPNPNHFSRVPMVQFISTFF